MKKYGMLTEDAIYIVKELNLDQASARLRTFAQGKGLPFSKKAMREVLEISGNVNDREDDSVLNKVVRPTPIMNRGDAIIESIAQPRIFRFCLHDKIRAVYASTKAGTEQEALERIKATYDRSDSGQENVGDVEYSCKYIAYDEDGKNKWMCIEED